jgi:hypothetical protein
MDALPGPRLAWMLVWALVPWLNLVVIGAESFGWTTVTDRSWEVEPGSDLFRDPAVVLGRGPDQRRTRAAWAGARRCGSTPRCSSVCIVSGEVS